jgi:hypothetical protein
MRTSYGCGDMRAEHPVTGLDRREVLHGSAGQVTGLRLVRLRAFRSRAPIPLL